MSSYRYDDMSCLIRNGSLNSNRNRYMFYGRVTLFDNIGKSVSDSVGGLEIANHFFPSIFTPDLNKPRLCKVNFFQNVFKILV